MEHWLIIFKLGSKLDAYHHVVKQRTLGYLMTLRSEEAICWKEKVLQEMAAFDETEDDSMFSPWHSFDQLLHRSPTQEMTQQCYTYCDLRGQCSNWYWTAPEFTFKQPIINPLKWTRVFWFSLYQWPPTGFKPAQTSRTRVLNSYTTRKQTGLCLNGNKQLQCEWVTVWIITFLCCVTGGGVRGWNSCNSKAVSDSSANGKLKINWVRQWVIIALLKVGVHFYCFSAAEWPRGVSADLPPPRQRQRVGGGGGRRRAASPLLRRNRPRSHKQQT